VQFEPAMDYSVDPSVLENDTAFKSIKLLTYFVLENLARAKEADNFRACIQQLKSLYEKHITACKWLLQHLMDSGTLIKELSLECPNEKIRIGFAELVIGVLKVLAPHEHSFWTEVSLVKLATILKLTLSQIEVINKITPAKDPKEEPKVEIIKQPRPIVVRFMDAGELSPSETFFSTYCCQVLSYLEDSRTYWRRFKQYFLIIRDFALFGSKERGYLLSRGIIEQYAEYFMGRPKKGQTRRVSVMDRFNLPGISIKHYSLS
jgi:hypothetical protein